MHTHAEWTLTAEMRMIAPRNASVAQLDRVLPSEGRGRGFESRRMRHISVIYHPLIGFPSKLIFCMRTKSIALGRMSTALKVMKL